MEEISQTINIGRHGVGKGILDYLPGVSLLKNSKRGHTFTQYPSNDASRSADIKNKNAKSTGVGFKLRTYGNGITAEIAPTNDFSHPTPSAIK